MKELWEQAILPYNLPFTVGLGIVIIYWVVTLTGAISSDVFGGDGDGDGSADGETETGGLMGILRFANAGDVPITIVLSVLVTMAWTFSLLANFFLNPGAAIGMGLGLAVSGLIPALVFTKLLTQPIVPFMRKLKATENSKPVIGETGLVKSLSLTHRYGQVEVIRGGEPPALLNCRLSDGVTELPRGTEVIIFAYDEPTGQYLVRPLPSNKFPESANLS